MKSSPVGRPRSSGRRDLPDNLVPRNRVAASGREVAYWYWRDPRDGKEKPLQCPDDKATAIRRARELNALIAREFVDQIVPTIISPPVAEKQASGMPFDVWAVHYLRRIERRDLAENTMRSRKSLINGAKSHFKDRPLHELAEDVAACSNFLNGIEDAGHARLALAMRSTLIDIFSEAHAAGALDSKLPNPFELTIAARARVKRARLTLEDYQTIWTQCEKAGTRVGVWMPNSVLLAMVTAQRREDVAIMQFKRGRDWDPAWIAFQRGEKHPIHPYPFIEDGLLWIVQQKTGNLVRIPLDLRLDVLKISVGDVVERCRSSIASRYLLHHTKPFGNAPVGSAIHKDTISRHFGEARDKTELNWVGRTPPTYHELRSLSERLYRDQGINTQTLLGHRHARMTEVYNDPRGAEWGTVKTA